MGCNCKKNRVVYTGPPSTTESVQTSSNTGGQPPITVPASEVIVADGRPTTSSR